MGTTRPPGTPRPTRRRPPFSVGRALTFGAISGFIVGLHLHFNHGLAAGFWEISSLIAGCIAGVAFTWAWLMFVLRALVDVALLSYSAVGGFILAVVVFWRSPWLGFVAIVGLIVVLTAILWDTAHPAFRPTETKGE